MRITIGHTRTTDIPVVEASQITIEGSFGRLRLEELLADLKITGIGDSAQPLNIVCCSANQFTLKEDDANG